MNSGLFNDFYKNADEFKKYYSTYKEQSDPSNEPYYAYQTRKIRTPLGPKPEPKPDSNDFSPNKSFSFLKKKILFNN